MASLLGVFILGLSVLALWLTSKLISFIRQVVHIRQVVSKIPTTTNHWLFGSLPVLNKVGRENLLFFVLEMAMKKKAKLIVLWKTFLDPIVFVVNSETIGHILRTSEPKNTKFGSSYRAALPWLGEGLLISTGRKWERNRKLLTPAFHFSILQPYVKIYNSSADILLEKLQNENGSSCEVFGPTALCTLDIILRCAFSYEGGIQHQGDSHPYVQAIGRISTLIADRYIKPLKFFETLYKLTSEGREFNRLCEYVHRFTEHIIEQRKDALARDEDLLPKRHLDFLDILLSARDEDNVGLSKGDIRAEVDTFLFEGHDTTASAISWSLYALAKYPDIQEKVFQEGCNIIADKDHVKWVHYAYLLPGSEVFFSAASNAERPIYYYISSERVSPYNHFESHIGYNTLREDLPNLQYLSLFLKEVLRMHSPVPFIGRMLSKPLTIGGVDLPAGMAIAIPIYVLHHNPEVWENPEEFRPERFREDAFLTRDPYAFVPFAGGPRNCIGQNFALNEEKVVVSRIVNRFKIELDPNHEVFMLPKVVMKAKDGIKLKFIARK